MCGQENRANPDCSEMGEHVTLSRGVTQIVRWPYPMQVSALICFSTCPDADTAERIASALVDERLAACVNILPGVRSVYRWQDAVERAEEVLLLVKTMPDQFERLKTRLLELHPYELPELLAVETDFGDSDYLRWVVAQTRPVQTRPED